MSQKEEVLPLSKDLQRRYVRLTEVSQNPLKKVYKAVDKENGISVVWNESETAAVQEAKKTLKREFEILKALGEHNHKFVQIFDWWTQTEPHESIVWISEMVSCTLWNFLERSEGVSIAAVKGWLCQIIDAIAYLHERGIVHRNLRLACIYYEGDGKVKIGNLGNAKCMGNAKCSTYLGLVNYMAPEYYKNNGYQVEVDIWSFGMCVIEMATLSVPYEEEFQDDVNAIKEAVKNGVKPHCFSRIALPLDMIDLIAICIQQDADKRYSAEELKEKHPFLLIDEESEEQDQLLNQYVKLTSSGSDHTDTTNGLTTKESWDEYLKQKLAPLGEDSWYLNPRPHVANVTQMLKDEVSEGVNTSAENIYCSKFEPELPCETAAVFSREAKIRSVLDSEQKNHHRPKKNRDREGKEANSPSTPRSNSPSRILVQTSTSVTSTLQTASTTDGAPERIELIDNLSDTSRSSASTVTQFSSAQNFGSGIIDPNLALYQQPTKSNSLELKKNSSETKNITQLSRTTGSDRSPTPTRIRALQEQKKPVTTPTPRNTPTPTPLPTNPNVTPVTTPSTPSSSACQTPIETPITTPQASVPSTPIMLTPNATPKLDRRDSRFDPNKLSPRKLSGDFDVPKLNGSVPKDKKNDDSECNQTPRSPGGTLHSEVLEAKIMATLGDFKNEGCIDKFNNTIRSRSPRGVDLQKQLLELEIKQAIENSQQQQQQQQPIKLEPNEKQQLLDLYPQQMPFLASSPGTSSPSLLSSAGISNASNILTPNANILASGTGISSPLVSSGPGVSANPLNNSTVLPNPLNNTVAQNVLPNPFGDPLLLPPSRSQPITILPAEQQKTRKVLSTSNPFSSSYEDPHMLLIPMNQQQQQQQPYVLPPVITQSLPLQSQQQQQQQQQQQYILPTSLTQSLPLHPQPHQQINTQISPLAQINLTQSLPLPTTAQINPLSNQLSYPLQQSVSPSHNSGLYAHSFTPYQNQPVSPGSPIQPSNLMAHPNQIHGVQLIFPQNQPQLQTPTPHPTPHQSQAQLNYPNAFQPKPNQPTAGLQFPSLINSAFETIVSQFNDRDKNISASADDDDETEDDSEDDESDEEDDGNFITSFKARFDRLTSADSNSSSVLSRSSSSPLSRSDEDLNGNGNKLSKRYGQTT